MHRDHSIYFLTYKYISFVHKCEQHRHELLVTPSVHPGVSSPWHSEGDQVFSQLQASLVFPRLQTHVKQLLAAHACGVWQGKQLLMLKKCSDG